MNEESERYLNLKFIDDLNNLPNIYSTVVKVTDNLSSLICHFNLFSTSSYSRKITSTTAKIDI